MHDEWLRNQNTIAELRAALEALQAELELEKMMSVGYIAKGDRLYDENEALQAENAEQAKRIAELELIEHVSRKLVECKGRYHTEQNMIALAKLFDAQKGTE
jgi:uncharacterized iron-regulated protein